MNYLIEFFSIPNIVIIITTIVLYFLLNKIFRELIAKHDNLTNHFFSNLSKTLLIIVSLFVLLSQYKEFDRIISSLLANSALIVAVLGFALQNTIKNILAGFMLISSETFKVGDRIRVPEKEIVGTIEGIALRHTTIKLVTNEIAIVPNFVMNEAVVINNDMNELSTSYPISIPILNTKDITLAKNIIIELINKNEKIINKETTFVTISEMTSEEVILKSLIWTKDIDSSFKTLSRLKLDIIKKFQENGIY